MQIKVGRKVYNTEKSPEVARKVVSYFGDSHGYEEILYHKQADEFFLMGQGGAHSLYAEAKITVLEPLQTIDWLTALLGKDEADKIMKKYNQPKGPAKKRTTAASKKTTNKAAAAKKTTTKATPKTNKGASAKKTTKK